MLFPVIAIGVLLLLWGLLSFFPRTNPTPAVPPQLLPAYGPDWVWNAETRQYRWGRLYIDISLHSWVDHEGTEHIVNAYRVTLFRAKADHLYIIKEIASAVQPTVSAALDHLLYEKVTDDFGVKVTVRQYLRET